MCDGETYNFFGQTLTTSGDYSQVLTNATGCDSIVTLHLTVNESVETELSETACDSYEWHGTTYTESGDYTWTGQTAAGCDSTVTLHLTITTGIVNYEGLPVRLWPNPAKTLLNVEYGLENAELQLFDATGRRVMSQPTSGNVTSLNISYLSPDVYVLHIVTDNKRVGTAKVVVE